MKALLVSSKYPPEYAGSGYRAHETYKRLRERFDIDFEVVCNSVEFASSERYTHEGVDVRRVVNSLAHRLWTVADRKGPDIAYRATNALKWNAEAVTTWRLLERAEFDYVHTFGYSSSTATAMLWCRRNDVPLITELCNNTDTAHQPLPILGRFVEYDLSERTLIVAISQHLAEACSYNDNVWVRPNPVDSSRFNASNVTTDRTTELTKFDEDDTVLLYVASFRPRKNHRFLVDVMHELPAEYKLVLAGPIDSGGKMEKTHDKTVNRVQERVRELGLEARVDMTVDFVDMAEYLTVADVFGFPSWREAMGTPLLESLCSGVPVVANADEPSFQEWICDGENGYLRELDAKQWANAVKQLSTMSATRRKEIANETLDVVADTVIDGQYYRLIEALLETDSDETLDVSKVLSEHQRTSREQ